MFRKLKAQLADKRTRNLNKRFLALLEASEVDAHLHGLQRLCDNPFHRHIILFIQPVLPHPHTPVLYHVESDWRGKMYIIVRHEGSRLEELMDNPGDVVMIQAPRKRLDEALRIEVERMVFAKAVYGD